MAARKASDKALLALAGTLMLSGAVASVFTTAGGGVALADGSDCVGDTADCEVYDVIPLEPDVETDIEWEEAPEPAASQSPSDEVDVDTPGDEPSEAPTENPTPDPQPTADPEPTTAQPQPKPQPTATAKPTQQPTTNKPQPKPKPTTVTKTVVKPNPQPKPVKPKPRKDPVKPEPKPEPKPTKDTFTVPAGAAQMVDKVNAERTKWGKPALKLDACLQQKAAQPWADTIARRNSLDHSGMAWTSKCPNIGSAGEIEGARYNTSDEVFTAWSTSLTHRTTMMKRAYNRAGVGIATAADGTKYWVMTFGQAR